MDGNALHFDDEAVPEPANRDFGQKACVDTMGGTVGSEFEVTNPYTPASEQGTIWKSRKHLYRVISEITKKTGKKVIRATHVRGIE